MRLPRLIAGRRKRVFYRLLLNGLAQGVLAVTAAWLVMRLFDLVAGSAPASAALFVALGLTVAIGAWLRRSERIQAELLGQHYIRAVRQRLYKRLLNSSTRDLQRRHKGGVLLKFVGDLSALRRWVSLGLARLLVAGLAVSVAVSALLWLHWPFALGITLVLAASGGWILYRGAALRASIEHARRCQARLASNVTEKLHNLTTVQAFGQNRREQRLMRRQSNRLLWAALRKASQIGSVRAAIDAAAGGCILMVLVLAALLPPDGLSPGMLAAVISIIGILTPPLRDLGRAQEYWLAAQVARVNILRVAAQTKRVSERPRENALRLTGGVIELRNVTVRGALSGFTARASGGSRVAIVGANGSGKSTLLGLIGRLFDPDGGQILIDGQDIAKVRLSSLRAKVAYVSSEVPLVSGSLRKNLCYGAGGVEPARLNRLLADCGLEDLVERLPGGLDARLAEGGSSLSQGERIRVALARALLRSPAILVLDEADANLDQAARQALDRNLATFPGTVLMASHRRSVLRVCDTLWVLREGLLERCVALAPDGKVVPLGSGCAGPVAQTAEPFQDMGCA